MLTHYPPEHNAGDLLSALHLIERLKKSGDETIMESFDGRAGKAVIIVSYSYEQAAAALLEMMAQRIQLPTEEKPRPPEQQEPAAQLRLNTDPVFVDPPGDGARKRKLYNPLLTSLTRDILLALGKQTDSGLTALQLMTALPNYPGVEVIKRARKLIVRGFVDYHEGRKEYRLTYEGIAEAVYYAENPDHTKRMDRRQKETARA